MMVNFIKNPSLWLALIALSANADGESINKAQKTRLSLEQLEKTVQSEGTKAHYLPALLNLKRMAGEIEDIIKGKSENLKIVQGLRKQVNSWEQGLKDLHSQVQGSLKEIQSHQEALNTQRQSYEAQLQQMMVKTEEANTALTQVLADKAQQEEHSRHLQSEITRLNDQITNYTAAEGVLKQQIENLKSQMEDVRQKTAAQSQAQTEEANQKLAEADQKFEALHQEAITRLNKLTEEKTALETEKEVLQTYLQKIEAQAAQTITTLKQRLEQMTDQAQQLQEKLGQVEAENQALKTEKEQLSQQSQEYQRQMQAFQTSLQQLETERTRLQEELLQLQGTQQHLQEQMTALQQENHRKDQLLSSQDQIFSGLTEMLRSNADKRQKIITDLQEKDFSNLLSVAAQGAGDDMKYYSGLWERWGQLSEDENSFLQKTLPGSEYFPQVFQNIINDSINQINVIYLLLLKLQNIQSQVDIEVQRRMQPHLEIMQQREEESKNQLNNLKEEIASKEQQLQELATEFKETTDHWLKDPNLENVSFDTFAQRLENLYQKLGINDSSDPEDIMKQE